MADSYGGTLDWDRVYRACHDPAAIAERVEAGLGPARGPVIFAGFPAAAAALAARRRVIFVDRSPFMADTARRRYPELHAVIEADVFEAVARARDACIALTGRLSAFWDTPAQFEALAAAIAAHPRQAVIVDFFDRDAVDPGQRFDFGTGAVRGHWVVESIGPATGEAPPGHAVTKSVGYDIDGTQHRYTAERRFFRGADVLGWARQRLPGREARLAPPLVPGDPGFTLLLRG